MTCITVVHQATLQSLPDKYFSHLSKLQSVVFNQLTLSTAHS